MNPRKARSDPANQPLARPEGGARGWLLVFAGLALFGLGASGYLAMLHWQVHNQPGHVSFCAISEKVNCDTVSMSAYSRAVGVPVAVWGLLFYGLLLTLALWGRRARRPPWPWAAAWVLNAAAVGVSVFLFLVSEIVIQSLCLFCMSLYLVNALGAGVVLRGLAGCGLPGRLAAALPLLGLFGGLAAFAAHAPDALGAAWPWLLGLGVPALVALAALLGRRPLAGAPALVAAVRHDLAFPFRRPLLGLGLLGLAAALAAGAVLGVPRLYPQGEARIAGGFEGLAAGRTAEGHPWIGAARPELTIVEYSDYECPFCRQAHELVRELVRENRDWLRLVHVHFPLDQACNPMLSRPFHLHACDSARAALCAEEQDAFWSMNDRLFVRRGGLGEGGLVMLAEELGLDKARFRECLGSERTARALKQDVALGLARSFRGTPAFVLGGETVLGLKDSAWWREAIQRHRRPAPQVSPTGR
jgi:protein-disulfide isomerase/uncharacterized membrane protein